MCCFLTPLAVATVTTATRRKFPAHLHVGRLLTMLWGAVVALVVDHAINGEITAYPPFFTALKSPEQTAVMLREIATTGTAMTLAILAVWGVMLFVERRRAAAGRARLAATNRG